jgi:quercetin dioxygenase-like cupin family protein
MDSHQTHRREPIVVHLRGDQSGGTAALVELAMPAGGSGPPLHVHPQHGEGFYVLEGEMTFQVGDEVVTAATGSFAFAPRGVSHTLANLGERDARILVLCAPAGFESYFERLAAGLVDRPPSDQATSVGPALARP